MEYENAKRSYEVNMHQAKQDHDLAIVQLQQQVQYQMSRANSLQQTLGNISTYEFPEFCRHILQSKSPHVWKHMFYFDLK